MKKKFKQLGLLALTFSLFLTGCTKGGNQKGNDGTDGNSGPVSGVDDEQGTASEDGDTPNGIEVGEFSGDWEAVEEYGYPPFWLKYADFESMEEKDVSDVMLCDTFLIGAKLTDILAAYSSFEFLYYDDGGITIDTNQLEDILDNSEIMIREDDYFIITAYPDEERALEREIRMEVYNLMDSEVSIGECIQNNQFQIYFDGDEVEYINGIFGVDFESEEFRTRIGEILERIGRPDRIYSNYYSHQGTDREGTCDEIEDILDRNEPDKYTTVHEEFLNVLMKGGGRLDYDLIYDKDNAVFLIDVNEYCYDVDEYNFIVYYAYGRMEYWSTRELYEEIHTEFPEKLVYDFD